MLSLRSNQRGLFEADHLWLDHVGRNSFYGFLALHSQELFKDEDFAALYHLKNGRPSVPPSLLASALLLQIHDRCSDEEARLRACFDARWKVALGLEMESRPFAKSTLQLFRAQLILNEQIRMPLDRSLELARKRGFLKAERKLKLALDTTNVLGWGAVKDTYNLLADGIVMLIRELARLSGRRAQEWAGEHQLSRYFNGSIKGHAEIDWSSRAEREEFLGSLVADADRLLELARELRSQLKADSPEENRLLGASQLLSQLLLQDVERQEGKVRVRQGTSGERIPSVHDPEMRHGRKSPTKRFDGHKLGIAVDSDEQLITAVDVMAGSAKDNEDALQLVRSSEASTGVAVEMAMGDAAYGAAATRREFLEANKKLVAKVPGPRENVKYFTKDRFQIDLTAMTCTCPAGQATEHIVRNGFGPPRRGLRHPQTAFQFAAKVCAACPLRPQCYSPKTRAGRTVLLHPDEELLAEARALQRGPDFGEFQRRRQVAEHRLARMVQLGIRKARYRGRTKTLFQAALTAAVANLTLIANRTGAPGPATLISVASKLAAKVLHSIMRALLGVHYRLRDLPRRPTAHSRIGAAPCSSEPAFRPGL